MPRPSYEVHERVRYSSFGRMNCHHRSCEHGGQSERSDVVVLGECEEELLPKHRHLAPDPGEHETEVEVVDREPLSRHARARRGCCGAPGQASRTSDRICSTIDTGSPSGSIATDTWPSWCSMTSWKKLP